MLLVKVLLYGLNMILATKLGLEDQYAQKFDEIMTDDDKRILLSVYSLEKRNGRLAVFGECGLPLSYAESELRETLEKMYGEDIRTANVCMLYGSRNPYTDIDLFVVSDNIFSYFNGWLDIRAMTQKEFHKRRQHLDLSVTDILFSGDLVFGSMNYVQNLKKEIQARNIKPQVIEYNKKQAEHFKQGMEQYPSDSFEHDILRRHYLSNRINAEFLAKGKKLLTLEAIRTMTNYDELVGDANA
jgi:hypothetical protein